MKTNTYLTVLGALIGFSLLGTSAQATPIISVDFTNPSKLVQDSTNAAARTLGGTGTYSFGTWVQSSVGEIDVSGSGIAKIRNNSIGNARAISVIFAGINFTDGVQYTVSFDVIGSAGGDDTGRYWLGAVNTSTGSVLMNMTPSTSWGNVALPKPFTPSGGAVVTWLADSASNGVLLTGENVDGTTPTSFNFTYTAGTNIGFAVGTYNQIFSIDNFMIDVAAAPVPEPSTYALITGIATLGLVVYRRRASVSAPAIS